MALDSDGVVVNRYDYEPFGKPMLIGGGAVTGERKGFVDREMDRESGTYNMGVRQLDGSQFLSADSKWEEFRAWTPYHYSHGNPLVLMDDNGENHRLFMWLDKLAPHLNKASNAMSRKTVDLLRDSEVDGTVCGYE